MSDNLLSIKQVAGYLGVTERTVHRYMDEQYTKPRELPMLKGFKLGKSWRFEENDVKAFLEELKKPKDSETSVER